MRKYIALITAVALLNCASAASSKRDSGGAPIIKSDWYFYSMGLYYKSVKDYKKAIASLLEAASYGTDLDQVHYQLAECYYGLFDYEKAVYHAQLSIKANKNSAKPYILTYNIYMNLQQFQNAASALESLLETNPAQVNVHYTLGNLYYSQVRDPDKAIEHFSYILELAQSESVEDYYQEYAHYYLGHLYYLKGDVERSIEHFKNCLRINSGNYHAVYILALVLMDQYSLDEAKRYALLYLDRYPENSKMNFVAGRIFYLQGNRLALGHLRRVMSGKEAEAKLSRALYLELLKKDDEAEKLLKEEIKSSAGFISPHIALARVSLRKKNKASAFSEFFTAGILLSKVQQHAIARENLIKALSINDKIPEVYFYIARSYEEQDNISLAIIYYKKSYALKPSNDVLMHIGYLYSIKNNFTEATAYLDKAISIEPGNSKPYFFKGLIYSSRENYPAAEEMIKKALSLSADNDTYHFYLATVLEKQNRIAETMDSLKKAIEYNPKNSRAYNYLGYLYADNNINLDESVELIKKALEYEPSNGAYLDSLGWAYYRKKDFRLALRYLLRAEDELEREKAPDPVVFDHLGDAYKDSGDIRRALDYWRKSLKLKKDPLVEKKINESNTMTK